MKIQLFDEKDLAAIGGACQKAIEASLNPKVLEDVLFNAFTRALRVVMREGQIPGWQPPVEQGPPASQPAPPPAPQPAPQPVAQPFAAKTAETIINGAAEGGISEIIKTSEMPKAPAAAPEKKKYRKLTEILKRVDNKEKPTGYVTLDTLRDEIGRDSNVQQQMMKWVWDREVEAIIVYNSGLQPTKGLEGGRLFVHKQQMIARNNLRIENSTLPVPLRRGGGDRQTAAE